MIELLALAVIGKAVHEVKKLRDCKKDERECQDLRDRADAILGAMDRRSR